MLSFVANRGIVTHCIMEQADRESPILVDGRSYGAVSAHVGCVCVCVCVWVCVCVLY